MMPEDSQDKELIGDVCNVSARIRESLVSRCAQDANPIICFGSRSDLVETVHRGVICSMQVYPDGTSTILHQAGDIDQLFYLRSALKYVQVLPLLESGAVEHYGFNEEEIAVMCASHNAEPCHLAVVRSILTKIDAQETCLACGGHTPIDISSAFNYIQSGHEHPFVNPIFNNCSGKHAGFIALCKYMKVPIEGYLAPHHPVQILVRNAICDIFGLETSTLHVGVDGCGAPQYAMSARSAALGIARLCQPAYPHHNSPTRRLAISQMISAISNFPYMVYGEGGFCTALMGAFKGLVIGKRGASGVYMSGVVGHGVGFSVKIDDGDMNSIYCVAMKCLEWTFSSPCSSAKCMCAKCSSIATASSSATTLDVTSENDDIDKVQQRQQHQEQCHMTTLGSLSHYMQQPVLNCPGACVGYLCPVPSLLR